MWGSVPLATVALMLLAGQGPEAQHTASSRPGPPVVWHDAVQTHGRPAIAGSRLYVLARDHRVVAFDVVSGAVRWTQTTSEPGEASNGSAVTVAGSVVVAGDFNLVAFDAATGGLRWRFVPATGHAPGVFLGEAAQELVFAGSGAGQLYAVRHESGDLAWTTRLAPSALASVFAPSVDGGVVAATYTEWHRPAVGGLGLVDARTGRILWRRPFPPTSDPLLSSAAAGGPIIYGDTIIATRGDGDIFGFARSNGAVKWRLPSVDRVPSILQGPLPLPPAGPGPDFRPLTRSATLLIAGSLKGDVVAWDLTTQRRRWRFLDESLGSVAYGISSDSDAVYVPFGAGQHVALSARTGAERWRTAASDGSFIWPAVSDRLRVFIGGTGGLNAIRR